MSEDVIYDDILGKMRMGDDGSGGGDISALERRVDTLEENIMVTAFEVYPHTETIAKGESTPVGRLDVNVSANTVQSFYIRSMEPAAEQNVYVEWGDGAVTSLTDLTPTSDSGEYKYLLTHDYATTGKFVVKIYGDTYFAIMNSLSPLSNIMCRVFESDLPTAEHLTNYSSFARGSEILTSVNLSAAASFCKNARNISGMFASCSNLRTVTGFNNTSMQVTQCSELFYFDGRLQYTDFKLPEIAGAGLVRVFVNTYQLTQDILSLLPAKGFNLNQVIDVSQAFSRCDKITCSDFTKLGEIFWNNPFVTWTNTSNCFAKYSGASGAAEFMANIPVSWGGTASDSIIKVYQSGAIYVTDTATTQAVIPLGGGTHWTFTQPLSGLTFTSVENSHDESVVKFTTGGTFSSDNVDIPASVEIIGNEPSFAADKSYCISVVDNGLVGAERTPGVTV